MRLLRFVALSATAASACAHTDNELGPSDWMEGQMGAGGYVQGTGSPQGCEVMALLQQNCQTCHGAMPIAGAPMSLVTHADLLAPARSDPTLPVYQMIQRRIRDTEKPMPPSGSLPDDQLALIDAWIAQGAPDCAPPPPPPGQLPVPGATSTAPGGTSTAPGGTSTAPGGTSTASGGTATGPIPTVDVDPPLPDATPPEECFELRAHGSQAPGDTTPFQVKTGEFYHNFIFKAPYDKSMKGLTFDAVVDNAAVVHHFLLFQVLSGAPSDGSHSDGLGTHPSSILITGWAPGGDPPDMPPGVGMELPEPGGYYELEIHYFNSTGAPAVDRSGIRVCVTSAPLENTATVTWLGTETIGVLPNAEGTATGTCTPSNPSGGDIHILQSVPHMHKIGSHMKTVINRAGGGSEVLIDKPFNFLDQRTYDTPAVVHPGDTLTTTCTFKNDTPGTVLWGPSSNQEMCYNFVISYPARALAHPGFSLEGSQNTCLW